LLCVSVVLYVHWMSVWTSLQHAWMDRPACLVDRYAIPPPSSEPSDAAGPRFHRRSWSAVRGGPVGQLAAGLVDAGERAAEAWAALGHAMGRRGRSRRRLVRTGPALALAVAGRCCGSSTAIWRRGVCAVPAVGPGVASIGVMVAVRRRATGSAGCFWAWGWSRRRPGSASSTPCEPGSLAQGRRLPAGCWRRSRAGPSAQLRWSWVCAAAVSQRRAGVAALAAQGLCRAALPPFSASS
jgi:hypothetical protein